MYATIEPVSSSALRASLEVRAAEGVRPQSMGGTLAQLEQMGMIVSTPDQTDGRRQLIELTAAGRERLEGVRQARAEWLAVSFHADFTEHERQVIIAAMALLERLVS